MKVVLKQRSGFTLAELLIVIAIIAVLISILFPVFGEQLEISRETTDLANVRSAYSEVAASALMYDEQASFRVPGQDKWLIVVPLTQREDGWTRSTPINVAGIESDANGDTNEDKTWLHTPIAGGICEVSYDLTKGPLLDWKGGSGGGSTPDPTVKPTTPPSGSDIQFGNVDNLTAPITTVTLKRGKVYEIYGKKYVRLNTGESQLQGQNQNESWYNDMVNNPSNNGFFQVPTGKIITSDTFQANGMFDKNDFYKDDAGNYYIHPWNSCPEATPPTDDPGWGNWVKIDPTQIGAVQQTP